MTQPPRRTVVDYAAPVANYMVSVPHPGLDVCAICHGPVSAQYSWCFRCNQARQVLGSGVADVVAAISLAPAGEQYAHDLYTYKRPTVPPELRRPRLVGLAAVLWYWLAQHEPCVAAPLGRERFDVITTVPSTSGRAGVHPLVTLVSGVVVGSSERHRPLLAVNRADVPDHQPAADVFRTTEDIRGSTVLIIDDTWTTGADAQSASAALKAAGASRAAVLTLGRWITPDYSDHGTWLAKHRRTAWEWGACCLRQH